MTDVSSTHALGSQPSRLSPRIARGPPVVTHLMPDGERLSRPVSPACRIDLSMVKSAPPARRAALGRAISPVARDAPWRPSRAATDTPRLAVIAGYGGGDVLASQPAASQRLTPTRPSRNGTHSPKAWPGRPANVHPPAPPGGRFHSRSQGRALRRTARPAPRRPGASDNAQPAAPLLGTGTTTRNPGVAMVRPTQGIGPELAKLGCRNSDVCLEFC